MEQILWAVKAAPIADAQEWAVLVAMSEAADQDGCNSFLSVETISDRTRLNPRTVQRRVRCLEERGLIRKGDQDSARMIPVDRRPIVYDLQVPFSFFRPEKRYDGGESELSVNVWRQGRGRAPLTALDRPEHSAPPEKKNRTDKGIKRAKETILDQAEQAGVTASHPEDGPGGVTSSHPRGDSDDGDGVTSSHPTLPNNPPQDPPRSDALRASTADPVETSSSNAQSRNASAPAAAAQDDVDHEHGDAPRAANHDPAVILSVMMLNPDEAARFRAWLVTATNATNPDGLIVTLHTSGRLSERLLQWRTAESGYDAPTVAQRAAETRAVHLEWCGRCDRTTRTLTATDQDSREYIRRCPDCNINAGQSTPGSGASQAIAFDAAVAAANDANGRGRAAFEAARAALPQGVGRRSHTIGDVIPVARVLAESEQSA